MKHRYFLAVGHHGTYHWLNNTIHPRKALLEACGRRSAQKIYIDKADGKSMRHVGYIVAGEWFDIFKVEPFKKWGEV